MYAIAQPFPLFVAPRRQVVKVQHFDTTKFSPDQFMQFCRQFGLKESQTAQSVQDVYRDIFQDETIDY